MLTANVCPPGPTAGALPDACFGVLCDTSDGSFYYAVTAYSAESRPAATGTLSVDGRPVAAMNMAAEDGPYGLFYLQKHDPALNRDVPQALVTGRRMSLALDPPVRGLSGLADLTLSGAAGALNRFGARCLEVAANLRGRYVPPAVPPAVAPPPAPPPQGTVSGVPPDASATPFTDAARFAPLETLARHDAGTEAQARSLLAARIAENQDYDTVGVAIDVDGYLLPFPDGQQALIVTLCHPTVFGITGCETHVFHASAGSPAFAVVTSEWIGGGPFWLDLRSGTNGLPNLVFQPQTSGGAFAIAALRGP